MLKIDSHQHFWKFDPVRDSWIDESMVKIRRGFYPEDLLPHLQSCGLDGCVVVQSNQSENENEFQLKHAGKHPFIKGVVGWVNLQDDDLESRLAYYSQFKTLKGFRHVLQGEPQRDFMLRPAFLKGIGLLKKFRYTYDILVFPDQLKYVLEFVSRFPNQPFVLNHLAKPHIKDKIIDGWMQHIQAIAECENVYCKISGMVTEADWAGWKKQDFEPYLDVVVNAFGTGRIMYGSDWPVCLLGGTYKSIFNIAADYFSSYSQAEKDEIFGGNATRFYGLK